MCAVLLITIFPVSSCADTGPKPSVCIDFENMGDELCYGTLLSNDDSTGPYSKWNGTIGEDGQYNSDTNYSNSDLDYQTWKAFVEYEDEDGYYFLQKGWKVSETKKIDWGYYPPNPFKILLYYPESQTFVVSGIYERYAFDSYYTVDMDGINIGSVEYNEDLSTDERIDAYKSYNYAHEIISFIARVIITILIEVLIALLFGLKKKKQILLIAGVNTATQILLNVLLNFTAYNSGNLLFALYIAFEVIIFVLEAVLYCTALKKLSEQPKKNLFYVVYALVANAASFGTGILLMEIIPQIF